MRFFGLTLFSAVLALAAGGCDPYSEPSSTLSPDLPSEAWRGTYTGRCLLTCGAIGVFEREMNATLRMMPALDEINIELFLQPDLAYSPKFQRTGPVFSDRQISFHIEEEVFIYSADLHLAHDRIAGAFKVTDLRGITLWEVMCLEVDRD